MPTRKQKTYYHELKTKRLPPMYVGGERGYEIEFNENFEPKYTPRFTKDERNEFTTRLRFIKLISKSVYSKDEFDEVHSIPFFMSNRVEGVTRFKEIIHVNTSWIIKLGFMKYLVCIKHLKTIIGRGI